MPCQNSTSTRKIDSQVATDKDKDEFLDILKTGVLKGGYKSRNALRTPVFAEKAMIIRWIYMTDNVPEDEQALAQISALMPEYAGRIEQVDAGDLVIHGGCFNCCSWTVYDAGYDGLPF